MRAQTNLERGDEHVVRVQVCDDLEPARQRDDLPLDMLVQDPT